MSDIRRWAVFPSLHPTARTGTPRCGSRTAETSHACGEPATWHVAWTLTPPALFSLLCDPHMRQARHQLVYADRHHATVSCDMPGTGWLVTATPSQCVATTTGAAR
ncbi:hypothetical protein ACWD0D_34030 [Streptomyces griseoincarnatus]